MPAKKTNTASDFASIASEIAGVHAVEVAARAKGLSFHEVADLVWNRPGKDDLEVYDDAERDRLLDFLMQGRVEFARGYNRLRMPVMSKVSLRYADAAPFDPSATITSVEFHLNWKRQGIDMVTVLTTRSPLKDLMATPRFRLPGETERQWDARRWA